MNDGKIRHYEVFEDMAVLKSLVVVGDKLEVTFVCNNIDDIAVGKLPNEIGAPVRLTVASPRLCVQKGSA